jgi:Flp pilus assembly protein TadD
MVALTAAGRAGEAIAVGKKLTELDPTDPLTASLLEEALRRDGKRRDANACGAEAQRLIAGDADAQKNLAADLAWLRGEGAP